MAAAKVRKPHSNRAQTTPKREKLPWPGLKSKDHLSRCVTRAVKKVREVEEKEVWARSQIARLLDYVPPETAMRLIFREARRRKKTICPGLRRIFSDFFGDGRKQARSH
jgi:hypothetical protein